MKPAKADLLQGILDLLILQTLVPGPLHGWGIAKRIQQLSKDVLTVNQGSLYPALYRLEAADLIDGEWGTSPEGRQAKFYKLTRIYGILSYTVERRTHEIGIRVASGASPGAMVNSVVGNGLKLTLAGLVVGFVGAFAVTRLLATLLFGVTPLDPVTFLAAGVLLAIVALVASYVPARRVTRIQPTIALRTE